MLKAHAAAATRLQELVPYRDILLARQRNRLVDLREQRLGDVPAKWTNSSVTALECSCVPWRNCTMLKLELCMFNADSASCASVNEEQQLPKQHLVPHLMNSCLQTITQSLGHVLHGIASHRPSETVYTGRPEGE